MKKNLLFLLFTLCVLGLSAQPNARIKKLTITEEIKLNGFVIDNISDDGTIATPSDSELLTSDAIKTYVDTEVAGASSPSMYTEDGTTPADLDVTITDNIDFGAGLLFLNKATNRVGLNLAGLPTEVLEIGGTTLINNQTASSTLSIKNNTNRWALYGLHNTNDLVLKPSTNEGSLLFRDLAGNTDMSYNSSTGAFNVSGLGTSDILSSVSGTLTGVAASSFNLSDFTNDIQAGLWNDQGSYVNLFQSGNKLVLGNTTTGVGNGILQITNRMDIYPDATSSSFFGWSPSNNWGGFTMNNSQLMVQSTKPIIIQTTGNTDQFKAHSDGTVTLNRSSSGNARLHIQDASGGLNSGLRIQNTGAGTSDYASTSMYNNANDYGQFFFTSSTYSTFPLFNASAMNLFSYGDGGVVINAGKAAGIIKFATGGFSLSNERMRISASGQLLYGVTSSSYRAHFNIGTDNDLVFESTDAIIAMRFYDSNTTGSKQVAFQRLGDNLLALPSGGNMGFGGLTSPASAIDVQASVNTQAALTVRGVSSQSEGILHVKASNGDLHVEVDENGDLIANENITLGDVFKMTPTATVPASPSSGWIYFDDGTNTTSTNPAPRFYNGTTWVDMD